MSNNNNTQKIVGLGLFTAIVIVLQLMGSFIRFGTFSISLVLVPVVIGAALYGAGAGAWLGFVFGVVVLLSGDAAAFCFSVIWASRLSAVGPPPPASTLPECSTSCAGSPSLRAT